LKGRAHEVVRADSGDGVDSASDQPVATPLEELPARLLGHSCRIVGRHFGETPSHELEVESLTGLSSADPVDLEEEETAQALWGAVDVLAACLVGEVEPYAGR
jgi:hypothetical protein